MNLKNAIMKKVFLSIVPILLAGTLSAQEGTVLLTNSGFENWSDGSPDAWTTSIRGNILMDLMGTTIPMPLNTNFGEQVSDAHSGSSALLLKRKVLGIPDSEYSFSMPGIAQYGIAGEFNIPLDTLMNIMNAMGSLDLSSLGSLGSDSLDLSFMRYFAPLISPGDVCPKTPSSLDLWMKFVAPEPDTMNIIAITKSNQTPVGFAMYSASESTNGYAPVSIPFMNALSPCDSICILIVSGSVSGKDNTELYVDDITLNYVTDTPENVESRSASSFRAYPNPADDEITVSPAGHDSYDYQLMDLTGRTVCSGHDIRGAHKVSVGNVAPGVYMLRIRQGQQTTGKKIIVR